MFFAQGSLLCLTIAKQCMANPRAYGDLEVQLAEKGLEAAVLIRKYLDSNLEWYLDALIVLFNLSTCYCILGRSGDGPLM